MRVRLSELQASLFEVDLLDGYDPEIDDHGPFPGRLDGLVLTVTDVEEARRQLLDVSNGYDDLAERGAPGQRADARRMQRAATAILDKLRKG